MPEVVVYEDSITVYDLNLNIVLNTAPNLNGIDQEIEVIEVNSAITVNQQFLLLWYNLCMAATSIGSTGNHPYPLAKMPELTDPADIQVALRNYHYGQNGVLAGGADATAGIAYYLK